MIEKGKTERKRKSKVREKKNLCCTKAGKELGGRERGKRKSI